MVLYLLNLFLSLLLQKEVLLLLQLELLLKLVAALGEDYILTRDDKLLLILEHKLAPRKGGFR